MITTTVTIPTMGKRKTKTDYHTKSLVGLRMDKALVEAVREIARRNHRSLTGEVTRLLEEFVAAESKRSQAGK